MALLMAKKFPEGARWNSLGHFAKAQDFAENEQHHQTAISIHRNQARGSKYRLGFGHLARFLCYRGHLLSPRQATGAEEQFKIVPLTDDIIVRKICEKKENAVLAQIRWRCVRVLCRN